MLEWEAFVLSDQKIDDIPTKEILAWMSDTDMPNFIHHALFAVILKRKGFDA